MKIYEYKTIKDLIINLDKIYNENKKFLERNNCFYPEQKLVKNFLKTIVYLECNLFNDDVDFSQISFDISPVPQLRRYIFVKVELTEEGVKMSFDTRDYKAPSIIVYYKEKHINHILSCTIDYIVNNIK